MKKADVILCGSCGKFVPKARYCYYCGFALPSAAHYFRATKCGKCGRGVPDGKYCSVCGEKLVTHERYMTDREIKEADAKMERNIKDFPYQVFLVQHPQSCMFYAICPALEGGIAVGLTEEHALQQFETVKKEYYRALWDEGASGKDLLRYLLHSGNAPVRHDVPFSVFEEMIGRMNTAKEHGFVKNIAGNLDNW